MGRVNPAAPTKLKLNTVYCIQFSVFSSGFRIDFYKRRSKAVLKKEITAQAKKVVATSPELPEPFAALAKNRMLTIDQLFGEDNAFAKKLGLVFVLKDDLKQVYEKFVLDLAKSQVKLLQAIFMKLTTQRLFILSL